MKRLESHLYGESQSVEYMAIWDADPGRVRVRIKRDSYDQQSYAAAELFDGEAWQRVAFLPRDEMTVLGTGPGGRKIVHAYLKGRDLESVRLFFETDESALLAQVELIVGGN